MYSVGLFSPTLLTAEIYVLQCIMGNAADYIGVHCSNVKNRCVIFHIEIVRIMYIVYVGVCGIVTPFLSCKFADMHSSHQLLLSDEFFTFLYAFSTVPPECEGDIDMVGE